MIEKGDLFLEHVRVILKGIASSDVFFFYTLYVIEIVLTVGQYLSRVIEVYSDHIIAQNVSNSIF